MSTYATDDYEFSFAKRTLANLEFIENRVREEREAGLKDNEITDAFEVTQLLNSFIGLDLLHELYRDAGATAVIRGAVAQILIAM